MQIMRDTQQTVEEVLNDLKAGGDIEPINDLAAGIWEIFWLWIVIIALIALLVLLIYWFNKKK